MADLSFAQSALTGLSPFQRNLHRAPDAIQNHAEHFESVMENVIVPRTVLGSEHTDGKFPFNLKFSFATCSMLKIKLPEIRVNDYYHYARAATSDNRGRTKVEIRISPYAGNAIVKSYALYLGQNKKVNSPYDGHVFNHILVRGQVDKIEEKLESLGQDPALTEWSHHLHETTLCVFIPSIYSRNPGGNLPLMPFRDSPDRPYEQFTFERELGKLLQLRITKIVEVDGHQEEHVFEIPLEECSIKSHPLFTNPKLEALWRVPIPDWIVFYSQLTSAQEEWHSRRHRDPRWDPNYYYKDVLVQVSQNPVQIGQTETFSIRSGYPTTSIHWICQSDSSVASGNRFDYLDENGRNPSQSYQLLRDKEVICEGDQTMSNRIMPMTLGWNSSDQQGSAPMIKALRKSWNSHYFSKEVPHGECQFGVQVKGIELAIRLGTVHDSADTSQLEQEDDIVIRRNQKAPPSDYETFHVIFFQEVLRSWTWKVDNDRICGCVVAQELNE